MAVNNHLMDILYSCWKYFGFEGAYFGNLNGSIFDWTYSWTKPMHEWCSMISIFPKFSKSFLISKGPFSDCSSLIPILYFVSNLFFSDPGFYSLQYLPLSFRWIPQICLQEIFKIFRIFSSVWNLSILIITVYLLLLFFRWQLIPSLASFKSPSSLDHFFSKPRGRIICRSVVKSKSPKARSGTLKIFLKLRINLTRPWF